MCKYFFILAFLLVGCSNGDNGGKVTDTQDVPPIIEPPIIEPPIFLSSYNFEIGGLGQGPDLFVDVGGQFDVAVDFGDTLRGRAIRELNSAPDRFLFDRFTTDAGSAIDVTVSHIQNTLDGSFTIHVTSELFFTPGLGSAIPWRGAFEVVTPTETVTVTVVSVDLFPQGVEMSLNGAAAVPFTFDEYADLLDDPLAETWQRRASLAGAVHEFVIERMFEFANLLDELEITESVNPIVTACDMFPGAPPAGVGIAQGEHVLTRLGSGEDLTPGDVFDWTFTQCWSADSHMLSNNSVQLQNYIEEIDEASNTLRRIGFGPDNNVFGGVLFFDWRLAETQENNSVYTIDPAEVITVDGGFSMVLSAP